MGKIKKGLPHWESRFQNEKNEKLAEKLEHNEYPDEPIRLDSGRAKRLMTKMKLSGEIAKKWE